MDVPQAFSDLMDISSQVEAAVVLDEDRILASSIRDEGRSRAFADGLRRLAKAAAETRGSVGLKRLEVTVPEGHVFLVRDGARLIGATTGSDPATTLVFYDLDTCLAGMADEDARAETAAEARPAAKTIPSDAAP